MWDLLRGPEKHQTIPERLDVTFHLVKPQEMLSDSSDNKDERLWGFWHAKHPVMMPGSSALWARKSVNSRHLSGSSNARQCNSRSTWLNTTANLHLHSSHTKWLNGIWTFKGRVGMWRNQNPSQTFLPSASQYVFQLKKLPVLTGGFTSVTTGRFRSLHGFLTTFSTQAPVAIQVQHSSKSSTISAQRVIHMLDVSRGSSGIYGKP